MEIMPWASAYSRRSLVRFSLPQSLDGKTILSTTLKLREVGTRARHAQSPRWGYKKLRETANNSGVMGATTALQIGRRREETIAQPTDTTLVEWTTNYFPDVDEWDLTGDVQQFVNGQLTNYGWLMKI